MIMLTVVSTALCIATISKSVSLNEVSSVSMDRGAEIIAYDSQLHRVFVIGERGTSVYSLESRDLFPHFLNSVSTDGVAIWEPTSIDLDPSGRGVGVISWIPSIENRFETQGVLQFFDTTTLRTIRTVEIGYHPDCVMFTPDGTKVLIANESEPCEDGDQPGGLSIIETERLHLDSLIETELSVCFYGFTDKQEMIENLRISAMLSESPEFDIEPEYLAPTNDGVWVSLQENNAIVYFDFESESWTKFINLRTSNAPLDPLDNNTTTLYPELGIEMLYQPDTIMHFESNGKPYLFLANEGEGNDTDSIMLGDAIALGLLDIKQAELLLSKLTADERSSIRKLRISTIDGDTDGDGDIDIPTAFGARGVSIHDALSGEMVWESREQIEVVSAFLRPDLYNHEDSRSDQSGPEPEGLAIGYLDDRVIGFVGLERSHMIFVYDLSVPTNPELLDVVALDMDCYPEGMEFVLYDGKPFLLVAAERCEKLIIYELDIE